MADFDQQVMDLRLRLTALNAELENSTNSLRRLKAFHEDGVRRLEQLDRDIGQKARKMTEAGEKIAEYEASLSRMYDGMQDIEDVLENNEADYGVIDADLREKDQSVSQIRDQREAVLKRSVCLKWSSPSGR